MQVHLKSAAIVACVASFAAAAFAADHRDAPILFGNGRTDLNDLYAFRSPANPNNTVLIITTNPFAGVLSPTTFEPGAFYDIEIYRDGSLTPGLVYRTTFSQPAADGSQSFAISRNGASVATGTTGSNNVAVAGGGIARVDAFDDPFFFDAAGFNNGFMFTGANFFAGANVNAIILEVPSSELNGASTNIAINARTANATNTQIDRTGRPAINTALIPANLKDAFNAGLPANDLADFGPTVNASITALSNQSNANALTPILLPDLLAFDTSNPAGFLNGRRLEDDVIDAELNLLSAGAVTTDLVNSNDKPFLGVFPYLAAPHVIPEPATFALVGVAAVIGLARRR